ncbi:MAG: tryptophan--tRNA ligase [Patescibacteria group bacterium]|nr:tryptophan--tRNA ligase [Patescibacteria group bacterium]
MKKMKKRILTGDNTTGRLHLGHYVGSLENRVKLQHEYETFILLADMHSLAYPRYIGEPGTVADSVIQVTMDNLAVGLDPEISTIFAESTVPEIYELATIFSMFVSHNRALRNPTIKEEIREKSLGDNYSLGYIFFPILQAADILCVKADLVPVGEDQLPHIEQTNEIVRRFNQLYGGEALKETKGLVGRINRLVGTDGNVKMTKSLGNCIYLSDSEAELEKKVMNMYTDPKRIHPTDKGTVESNPVFIYLDAFGKEKDKSQIEDFKIRYREGKVGDVEVKKYLVKVLNDFLDPIRKRRKKYEANPEQVIKILEEGTKKAREEAIKTLTAVKNVINLNYF